MMKYFFLTATTTGLLLAACGQAVGQAPVTEHVTGHAQDILQQDRAELKSSDINWAALGSYEHELSNSPLSITRPGTHILSGTSSSSVTVSADGNVRLLLSGVNIHSHDGPAIYIAEAKNAVVELAEGSVNFLEDGSNRKDKDINGVIYSSDDLMLQGTGKLSVKSNFKDGIVSKDDLEIFSGQYDIISNDDGIRGKDSVRISGGTMSITSKKDGIKSSNDNDSKKGNVHITGGSITIDSGDDGISAINTIQIDGGHVNVLRSLEGMEASTIIFNGGVIRVVADDDGINAVNNNGRDEMEIIVTGGNINVTVGYGDTDAFDSNGTIMITGGDFNVTAPTSAFDSNRGSQMTGGTLIVNGEALSELPPQQGGRGRRRR